jgi:hypothetical protein
MTVRSLSQEQQSHARVASGSRRPADPPRGEAIRQGLRGVELARSLLVRLLSGDGASVEFRPVAYQFGDRPGGNAGGAEDDADWDANWLMIRGDIRPAAAGAWTFCDPCLTTWEAGRLSAWLHAAASPDRAGYQDEVAFTEPNLGFILDGRDGERVRIRVRFSHESLPDWLPRDVAGRRAGEYAVPLDVRRSELSAAARSWDRDRLPFPER